ncbi:Sodium/pantothenate symporter [Vibrio stylophorae]|uniref:Sodium/pantothenate symporter n=1 Tax=Vibrio stylophorae TaxID=659351 RepID=A0ABM8ZQ17_9VIBR|nr:sodium/pantothenate symporter [Vibrio stylophorae]CAH0532396.1 Sodium/pantothenate symporter [Vibrio stylophorae]
MNHAVLWPMALYLVGVFALAFLSRRHLTDSKGFMAEYLMGSRSMGGFVLAMTLAATFISASSFIGGPGAAYKHGLGWVLLAMIQLPTAWLTLGVLGKKFAIEARRHNAMTLNDMLYARYQNRGVVIFASLALLLAFFGTMVVQFVGGARLLQSAAGLSYQQGLMLFALTVGIYTTIGGFRAVVMTDTLQGIMMLIGTVALLGGVIYAGGGLTELVTKLHSIDPALTQPYGANDFLSQPFMLSFWVLVCFGVIGLPHTAVRCMAYKDTQSLHRAMVIGTVIVGFLIFGMHFAGALGRAIIPSPDSPDNILPELMITVLPPVLAGVFLAGPMAAIMSTIDSQLIQASATLLKDLYWNYVRGIGKPAGSNAEQQLQEQRSERLEKRMPGLSLWVTGIFSLLVFAAAFNPPEMIIWLNLLAFGGMQAVFFWPLVLGLYWQRASSFGAASSMIAGLGCYAALVTFKPDMNGIHAIVPTLLVSLLAFVGGSLLRPNTATQFGQTA